MSKFDMGEFARTLRRDVPDSGTGLREIPLDQIVPNSRNFYPKVEEFEALMASIQANGLLEPLTVTENRGYPAGTYRLISGHNRWRCLNELHIQEPEEPRWTVAACLVLPPMTEAQELCALIEANRQRKKTPGILQQEAEALSRAYAARKAAGESLPGRVRDRIAADLGVSKTKLSNLDAIKSGLKVPGLIQKWEYGGISEAAALEIARMDKDAQYRLLDWMRVPSRSYSIKEVRKFQTIWTCAEHKCPETAGLCENAEEMYRVCYHAGAWNCAGCCKRCLLCGTCEAVCRYAQPPKTKEDVSQRPSTFYEVPGSDTGPTGQLCISRWMPCGANPGPETGRCAALMDLGTSELHAKILWWDGAKWLFKQNGPEAGLLPAWWMRLPPDPSENERSLT